MLLPTSLSVRKVVLVRQNRLRYQHLYQMKTKKWRAASTFWTLTRRSLRTHRGLAPSWSIARKLEVWQAKKLKLLSLSLPPLIRHIPSSYRDDDANDKYDLHGVHLLRLVYQNNFIYNYKLSRQISLCFELLLRAWASRIRRHSKRYFLGISKTSKNRIIKHYNC